MECILSYIEFVHLQKYLIEQMKNNYDKDEIDELDQDLTELHPNIPLSEIIEKKEINIRALKIANNASSDNIDEKFLYDAKIKAYNLYNKYVRVGSEYEINVAAKLRMKLINIYDNFDNLMNLNISLKDIFLSFEGSKKEMFVLLRFSLTRWKKEASFNKIKSGSNYTTAKRNFRNVFTTYIFKKYLK